MKGEGGSSSGVESEKNMIVKSKVVDLGSRRGCCGYCKSSSSFTHGLSAHSLTVDDYQALLDRGWRRAGCYLYKPEMDKTCCPQYTIRLNASEFIPSKEQQRVSKQMQRFLDGTLQVKESQKNTSKDSSGFVDSLATGSAVQEPLVLNTVEKNEDEQLISYLSDQIDSAVRTCIEHGEFSINIQLLKPSVKKVSRGKRKLLTGGSEDLLYSSNISFQIKAALMRGSTKHIMIRSGGSKEENDQLAELTPHAIADKMVIYLNNLSDVSYLSVKACNGHINFYSATKQACSDKVAEIDTVQKECHTEIIVKESSLKKASGSTQGKRKRLEIIMKRSSFDPEEYDLYRRYQIAVHNDAPDHVSESSYRRFLVDTPLVFLPSKVDDTVPHSGFGSFHQQYLIDDQLVAVGVIDILPRCLSSKYLFWDPDFAFLSLGKYSALYEIGCVKENQFHCPSLQYYYMGYYIHSCNKMRYKSAYGPSELLCPLRYQWVPFETAKPLLDRERYVILSNFHNLHTVESLTSKLSESQFDLQQGDSCREEFSDVPFDKDEEILEIDSEDFSDKSDLETSVLMSSEFEDASVGNVLIGLGGSQLRYKDIHQALSPEQRSYLETKLHKYKRVVGEELSQEMVLSLE
ncbi:Arginyl-tRNA--protein transferase [Heracleum sosnowskyi]|uniref:Arginyl-tRNA--protein transferase n=1 Tax=Heracleum sosnowskyi TaxID=360622 RepID=A0AAD8M8X5_9APIA|nr:Arginyl-tRNA--protein transferase [Heracleum sosnowskyi]